VIKKSVKTPEINAVETIQPATVLLLLQKLHRAP